MSAGIYGDSGLVYAAENMLEEMFKVPNLTGVEGCHCLALALGMFAAEMNADLSVFLPEVARIAEEYATRLKKEWAAAEAQQELARQHKDVIAFRQPRAQ